MKASNALAALLAFKGMALAVGCHRTSWISPSKNLVEGFSTKPIGTAARSWLRTAFTPVPRGV